MPSRLKAISSLRQQRTAIERVQSIAAGRDHNTTASGGRSLAVRRAEKESDYGTETCAAARLGLAGSSRRALRLRGLSGGILWNIRLPLLSSLRLLRPPRLLRAVRLWLPAAIRLRIPERDTDILLARRLKCDVSYGQT